MSNFRSSFVIALCISSLTAPLPVRAESRNAPSPKSKLAPKFVEGEVLVEFSETLEKSSASAKSSIFAKHGLSRLGSMQIGNRKVGRFRVDSKSVSEAVASLRSDSVVKHVQPNYIYHAYRAPNDAKYTQQWGANNSAQTIEDGFYKNSNPGLSGKDSNLEAAWDIQTDCSNVLVAIVDTGINYEHEDLGANLWSGGSEFPNHGYDFVDGDDDPLDLNGHGTHVAGIIGGRGNNGTGVAGVCWKAKLMGVRVLDAAGTGTTENIVKGIQFAVEKGAKIINLSLGNSEDDDTFREALESASNKGVIVVAAAGNDGVDLDDTTAPNYPCSYTSISQLICVAALDQSYELATFSNFGKKTVHLGAPGTNILSSVAGKETSLTSNFHASGSSTLDWTKTGGEWAYASKSINVNGTSKAVDVLVNPANWDGKIAGYANNSSGKVYKSFDTANALSARLEFSVFADIHSSDSVKMAASRDGGDPFLDVANSLGKFSGSTEGSAENIGHDLNGCMSEKCSIGFEFKSDASGNGFGVAIFSFVIRMVTKDTATYDAFDGTSMAAPQVAGLAALIQSANPNYTSTEVIDALYGGAQSVGALEGKTVTGKAIDAGASLRYLAPVTGLTVKQK